MTRPTRYSIVTAVYDVEPYLPAFIASIEDQQLERRRIEVIAIDDGSTDGSLRLLEAWRDRGNVAVTVLSQPNWGQGAARNAGLERATGDWITFTDPDDMLAPGYLAAADAFAGRHPEAEVLSGRRMPLNEARGKVQDTHPRRWQFAHGSRVADLGVEPNVFPVSASTALFRGDRLRATGLRYDPDLRPHFEDQHFSARFLLALERPLVGLVADAVYVYRVRLAKDSSLQRLHADPRSYTTVFERGYLDLVRRSRDLHGRVEPWIQQLILYELTRRYLREADAPASRIEVPEDLEPRFHDLFGELARSLDPEQVYAHSASRLQGIWAELIIHGYRDERWVPATADRTEVDRAMRLQRIAYRYRGAAPTERLELDGRALEPPYAKVRAISYFGRTQLQERILWAPAERGLRLLLDGRPVAIGAPHVPLAAADATRIAVPRGVGDRIRRQAGRLRPRALVPFGTRLLASMVYRPRFARAWLVMDGVDAVGGDGERLFAYLRRERPDVNAWFAVRAGTPGWRRLRGTGERHLVAFGGLRWRMLVLNARWLLVADADDRILLPRRVPAVAGRPPRTVALLQRDAGMVETPAWWSRRRIGLFPVRTAGELASLAGDGTRSGLTAKEVRLTGLPLDDDGAASRIVAAVEELSRPWSGGVGGGQA